MSFPCLLQLVCSKQFQDVVTLFKLEKNELIDDLDKLSDVHEKLALIESTLEKYNLFGYLDVLPESSKNDETSTKFRDIGNRFYIKKDFMVAMGCYIKSIIFALPNSVNIILGYSNRSAVLYKLGEYRKCLEAIELAKNCSPNELPPKLLEKLEQRKKDCSNHLTREVKEQKALEFKLSYPKHQKCSDIANCLELKQSIKAHNFFYTTRNLKAGDVLSTEQFLSCNVLDEGDELAGSICFYCLNLIIASSTIIICPNCVHVSYCSIECRLKDWESSHKYLCSIGGKFKQVSTKLYLALKVSLQGINIFRNVTELNSYCKNKKLFNGNNDDAQKKEKYKIFYNVVNSGHSGGHTDKNDFSFLIHLVLIKRCLFKLTEIKFENDKEEKLFINLIIHNYNNSVRSTPFMGNPGITVAGSVSELFYHSCSPNVEQFIKDGRIITIAIRPIKANETLTKCYGWFRYYELPKVRRQEHLKFHYGFTCSCEACRNNYGVLPSYGDNPSLPPVFMPHEIPSLMTNNFMYTKLMTYLQRHGNNYPCRQLIVAFVMLQNIWKHDISKLNLK